MTMLLLLESLEFCYANNVFISKQLLLPLY